jgi:4'-phosphopantetheinyl transferase
MSSEIDFKLADNEVHIWRAPLTVTTPSENEYFAVLNPQERIRAERFHFPLHKRRFIAARGILRQLLSRYQKTAPDKVDFLYNPRGKPSLADVSLQFNVSHSHEIAVYALTKNSPIGVDIEKSEKQFNDSVAERYLHPDEYAELNGLTDGLRAMEFYRIWARKEAVIKAIGDGMHIALNSFSTATKGQPINIVIAGEISSWHLRDFNAHADYQSAVVTQNAIDKIHFFEWDTQGPVSLESFADNSNYEPPIGIKNSDLE